MTSRLERDVLIQTIFPEYSVEQVRRLTELSVQRSTSNDDPVRMKVQLPEWAADLGVDDSGELPVPRSCMSHGETWPHVDWFQAIAELLTCDAEIRHEQIHGPIHSYRARLPKAVLWQSERPWVNRYLMFLKRWASQTAGSSEQALFGWPRKPTVHLTHDVDYVQKTLALRGKQVAFDLWNWMRPTATGSNKNRLGDIVRSAASRADYWQFQVIRDLEAKYGATSLWNFYAGGGGPLRSPDNLLLDPGYDIQDPPLQDVIGDLQTEGHRVGLHQAFHSWKHADKMRSEKQALEYVTGRSVDACRQHWLRFSFQDTWQAQEVANFKLDLTLGFNEAPAYRNGAALRCAAWISKEQRFSDSLYTVPLVLMDSHLFDYGQMDAERRHQQIDVILDELAFVEGEISIVWHQRVFHPDYGWGADYEYLLAGIRSRGIQIANE